MRTAVLPGLLTCSNFEMCIPGVTKDLGVSSVAPQTLRPLRHHLPPNPPNVHPSPLKTPLRLPPSPRHKTSPRIPKGLCQHRAMVLRNRLPTLREGAGEDADPGIGARGTYRRGHDGIQGDVGFTREEEPCRFGRRHEVRDRRVAGLLSDFRARGGSCVHGW